MLKLVLFSYSKEKDFYLLNSKDRKPLYFTKVEVNYEYLNKCLLKLMYKDILQLLELKVDDWPYVQYSLDKEKLQNGLQNINFAMEYIQNLEFNRSNSSYRTIKYGSCYGFVPIRCWSHLRYLLSAYEYALNNNSVNYGLYIENTKFNEKVKNEPNS